MFLVEILMSMLEFSSMIVDDLEVESLEELVKHYALVFTDSI